MNKCFLVVLMLLVSAQAVGQTTTKLCVPVPPPAGGVASCQDVSMTNALPVQTGTAVVTLKPLVASSVGVAGKPVIAIAAGDRTRGGWIRNPNGAKQLCINELGEAGVKSVGSTTCIGGGEIYLLSPSGSAVSVVSSDSPHPFSGYGWTN